MTETASQRKFVAPAGLAHPPAATRVLVGSPSLGSRWRRQSRVRVAAREKCQMWKLADVPLRVKSHRPPSRSAPESAPSLTPKRF